MRSNPGLCIGLSGVGLSLRRIARHGVKVAGDAKAARGVAVYVYETADRRALPCRIAPAPVGSP